MLCWKKYFGETKKSQPEGCDFFVLRILRKPNYSAENLQTKFLSP